ncbi:glucoside xylosyltransferase 1-like [Littorina saxatilis]|uniref:UDP-D-xylose:beta-D-glucoside alpha-1,3-D-xylosyltransferase n=1 Tax=Littorina saxatilis TaxID=31220 RepID=A0AAN9B464_9CAEN
MKWKMLFRIGLTLVIVTAILLFYLNNRIDTETNRDKLRSGLVGSNYLAFREAQVHHEDQFYVNTGVQKLESNIVADTQVKRNQNNVVDAEMDVNGEEKGDGREGHAVVKSPGKDDSILEKKEDSVKPVPANQGRQEAKGSEAAWGLQPLHRRVGKETGSHTHKIHMAVVACGDRAEEVIVLLKSAVVMTTTTPLVLHIFAERELHTFFKQQLNFWPPEVLERVEYRIYDISFPASENQAEWKKLFKLCASQRLFLPSLLTDIDALIYVDTDILFVSPLDDLWSFFSRFSATQLVALAPEHEDPNVGWYNRFARHPYVPPMGVNSGVMLMNLTRLRTSTWLPSILKYFREYRLKITWGDQDLINIYFHDYPDELYQYSCEWNYRPDHCMYMSVCKPAEEKGAYVLHGCRRVMHNDKQPAFKAVYKAFKDYRFGEDLELVLLRKMKINLEEVKTTQCGKVPHIFLKQLEKFISEGQGRNHGHQNRQGVPAR